jgi:tetratricopeptide (TPR) repeat protein
VTLRKPSAPGASPALRGVLVIALAGLLVALGSCAGRPASRTEAAGEPAPAVQEVQPEVQPAPAPEPPPDAASLRRLAEEALAGGRMDEAQEYSARALDLEPLEPEGLLLRARVLTASGSWPQALRLLELQPVAGLAQGVLLRAEILTVDAREEQRALELLRGAQDRFPEDARLPELEGRVLLSIGRESEGRERLLRALELDPGREPALRLLLEQAVRAKRWEEAAGYLERLDAEQGSETELALAYRVQERLGHTEQALAYATRLYEARPEAYAAEYASALLANGDREEALGVVQKHLAAAAPLLAGRLLVIRAEALEPSDPELAMQALEQALALDPANFRALVRLGELHAARQDYHLARQYLRLALELDPSNAELAARLEGLNY